MLLNELDALPTLWEVQGTVAAPVAAVAELLLAVTAGRVGDDNLLVLARASAARQGAMTVVADGHTFRAELAGHVEPVEIQVDGCRLAVQSWYGGVHAVTACSTGTRVVHRVQRVLPEHPGFAPGIAELGMRTRMARDLQQVLAVIADRLGC
ncbi:hypothetical protein [Kribbella jiaozuonensis]|uniref:Polyketide cyclase/dehydrase/lipid transport protein n=1 Tax=Kribbella jiaozuonensis TaxID=2575441 RepID=A0A4U3LJN8_9ACTN|nr:hypothetical protein [Kribbella jiaozuonensis]TKK75214.1 hypothetical protein FDA38_32865 [Kribbella jiaozuonensis]